MSRYTSLTQCQIISITGLSERTVKSSLKRLVSQQYILAVQDFCDMRRKSYKIRGENQ
ncbi:MAG: hypothetical protein HY514_02670 [Candidatus Aenigmarchaeota archaeon]|nr:hypothetical protein [Candidatus Aenigmarchaeota archaeon]